MLKEKGGDFLEHFEQLNTESLMAMANRLGLGKGDPQKQEALAMAARQLEGKNSDQLMEEVRRLRDSLGKDREELKKQLAAVKGIRVLLNRQQRETFDGIMRILEEEEE